MAIDESNEREGAGNSLSLKKNNLRLVLKEIYKRRSATILELAKELNMSIPTVTTCLKAHVRDGFVLISDDSVYTGGRKSKVYTFNSLRKISIGIKLLKEGAEIVATDLYGSTLEEAAFERAFEDEESYYSAFGKWASGFADALPYDKEDILGIVIALQGLISDDGKHVYFSEILKSSDITIEKFKRYIPYNVRLMHDLEAAALYEEWSRDDLGTAFYFILNKNFGAMLIINKFIKRDKSHYAYGTIEHMTLDPNGDTCYCGRRGCVETFCSVDRLKEKIKPLTLTKFFQNVREKKQKEAAIWNEYLSRLSIAINNVRMIYDTDILIGGYLVQYMNDDDFKTLEEIVNKNYPFKERGGVKIIKSSHTDDAIKLGAALNLVDKALGLDIY